MKIDIRKNLSHYIYIGEVQIQVFFKKKILKPTSNQFRLKKLVSLSY